MRHRLVKAPRKQRIIDIVKRQVDLFVAIKYGAFCRSAQRTTKTQVGMMEEIDALRTQNTNKYKLLVESVTAHHM